MKGPGLRIDLDVRRIWRCAKCGKATRTAGHVTAQRCGCSEESPWMRLELPPKREPFQPPHREPLPEFGEDEPATPAPESPTAAIAESPAAAAATAEAAPDQSSGPMADPAAETSIAAPPAAASEPGAVEEFGAGLPPAPENQTG